MMDDTMGKLFMEDKARCCQSCKAPCAGDFKKVVDLQYSGLVIYLHTKKDDQKKAGASKIYDTFILHNTGSKQIKRPDYITELHRFKSQCGQCNTIVQRVRSLLDEVRAIRENEIISVCEHCKRANQNKTCKRCDFIVSKFISLHQKKCEEKQQRFKIWLCKVKQLLQAILDGESGLECQHRVYKDSDLERILRELKAPLGMREPDIDLFPSLDSDQMTSQKNLSESKEMLEKLLSKIQIEGENLFSSDETMKMPPRHVGESSGLGTDQYAKDTDLSGESKDLSRLLSQEVYNKELIKRLLDLSKALPHGLHLNRKLIQQIINTLNTTINQGLSTDIIVKLIKELKELNKIVTQDLSEDLNKEVIQGLIHDLNDLLKLGSSKDSNKDLVQLLIDLSELLTHELSRGLTKEQSQLLSRSVQKDTTQTVSKIARKDITQAFSKRVPQEGRMSSPTIQSKEISRGSSKSLRSEISQGSPKCLIKERQRSPKGQSKEDTKDLFRNLHKGLSKEDTLTRDLTRGLRKDVKQGSSKIIDKNISQGLPKGVHIESRHGSYKGVDKDVSKNLPKTTPKENRSGSPKCVDKHVSKVKETITLSKGLHKEATQELPKDTNKGITQESSKDLNKASKDSKPGSSTIRSKEITQTSSKDTNNQLVQNLANLNKELAGRVLNKGLIQELSSDINKALAQASPDLNKKIIHELTDLCKPAVKGIPKSANMQLIQGLINDTSAALTRGLSKEHNKKSVQGLLNDLNQALRDGSKEHSCKGQQLGSKKGSSKESKEYGSGLSSKALAPSSQEVSKKRLKDLSRQRSKYEEDASKCKKTLKSMHGDHLDKTVSSDEGMYKKITKSGKSISKNKSLIEELKSKHGDRIDKAVTKSEEHRKHRKIEKTSKKTRMELKGKTTFSFEDEDDSYTSESETETEYEKSSSIKKTLKEKTPKASKIKVSKGKENLLPEDEEKKKDAKMLKPKELSESVLLRLLRENELNAEKYKLFKQKQAARQREMERRRLRRLSLKKLYPPKKKEEPPTPPEEMSDSILQSNIRKTCAPKFMVRGETVTHYDPRYKDEVHEATEKPLLFKTQLEFGDDVIPGRKPKYRESIDYESMFQDAVIRYRLSNREFIDNGWTQLPTKKIMRRMNIYKMKPANPQYDWFARHKQEKELFYDNGGKLADIDEDGRGHWYYRNGAVALDYYNAQDSSIGQRYVVYSSGEEMENGKLKPRTILAVFDVCGNGVVYDHFGNVRLKYNQSEGLLVDPKVGPPCKWKWHTLNDPPVLHPVFVNAHLKERDPNLDLVEKPAHTQDATNIVKAAHPEMLAIELENSVKEKTSKHLQKFKPFQIRMKVVKLNEQFSLKILDQANINLLYRDGVTSLKLNLGMLLISNEIIDTDTSDMADVATPYDKLPPKSHSVENIQKILKTVRNGKLRPPSELTVKVSI